MTDIEIRQLAIAVARRYKRRCWWADLDDLTGEASAAVLKAVPNWDPEVGVPIEAYVWRAAAFACKHWLWKNTAPVNASSHSAKKLKGLHRVGLKEVRDQASDHDPLREYTDMEWRQRVKAHLEEIIATTPNGDLAAAVLLEERRPVEMEADVQHVYKAAAVLRKRLRQSYPLYQLWKELPQ